MLIPQRCISVIYYFPGTRVVILLFRKKKAVLTSFKGNSEHRTVRVLLLKTEYSQHCLTTELMPCGIK